MKHAAVPDLATVVQDLHTEGEEFYRLLRDMDTGYWTQTTLFKDWTVWDVLAHLHFSDYMALTSIESADGFRQLAR
ncbi:MAG: maleylpyruvate isomerase N-terminal domain-containing protein, partial [Pseudomonadales bacterium]